MDVIKRFLRSVYKFLRSGWDFIWDFANKHDADDSEESDAFWEAQKHPLGSLLKLVRDNWVFYLLVALFVILFVMQDPLKNGLIG